MKVYKGSKLIADVELLTGNSEISKGLRFSRKLKGKKGLLFKLERESRFFSIIDMFFVFYSIDIVWLDRRFKVVDKKEGIRPFMVKIPKKKAMYVLEVMKGRSRSIKIGDTLRVKKR